MLMCSWGQCGLGHAQVLTKPWSICRRRTRNAPPAMPCSYHIPRLRASASDPSRDIRGSYASTRYRDADWNGRAVLACTSLSACHSSLARGHGRPIYPKTAPLAPACWSHPGTPSRAPRPQHLELTLLLPGHPDGACGGSLSIALAAWTVASTSRALRAHRRLSGA